MIDTYRGYNDAQLSFVISPAACTGRRDQQIRRRAGDRVPTARNMASAAWIAALARIRLHHVCHEFVKPQARVSRARTRF
jgi:hypothetical protein